MKLTDIEQLNDLRSQGLRKLLPNRPRIAIGMGTCGIGNGAEDILREITAQSKRRKIAADILPVGCFGFCAREPLVSVYLPGKPLLILAEVVRKDIPALFTYLQSGSAIPKKTLCKIQEWDHITGTVSYGRGFDTVPLWNEIPFYAKQLKIVLRDCGLINPDDIMEYFAVGGYQALYTAVKQRSPDSVIEEVKISKLRGRGGAGFPTGRKWEILRRQPGEKKYVICNADEGDPGAYMNRNEIESDPHMLLEGMLIGAYACGADEGVIYIRAEYPLAIKRLEIAISQATEMGLMGDNIMGSAFSFNRESRYGAGAFVCGEETALLASLEGER
ncbi:MAG: proton-conducting membrane transporter, partial [Candidatus Omnitrophica bacterium]|nr:proton-conducting membrane transporter [Candidatus Omnitrophota bacterium]